jgi:hypothetical protein
MSESTPLIIFVTISLLLVFILTPLILMVNPSYETVELNGSLAFFNATVNAEIDIFGIFGSPVHILPFENVRDFLTEQIIAWSYLPTAIMVILSSGLIIGGIYAFIKALPTT